jgi:hypothetical protein
MATETESGEELTGRARHRRSITVTVIAALAGIAAGVAADTVTASATDSLGLVVMAAATAGAFGVLRVAGVDVEEFSKKDIAFVVFMSFSLWFVTWAILLTAG